MLRFRSRRLRFFMTIFISLAFIWAPVIHAAEELALPAADLVAPEIQHVPVKEQVAVGGEADLRAKVTDNVGIKEVILFYRTTGVGDYKRVKMTREPGTDFFAVTIPEVEAPGIEYYMQATDLSGNTLLRGHSFSPLTVQAVAPAEAPAEGVVTTEEPAEKAKPKGGVSKWVWIGLGTLAAGALVAASGGDGGGGGGGGARDDAEVVITAPVPGN